MHPGRFTNLYLNGEHCKHKQAWVDEWQVDVAKCIKCGAELGIIYDKYCEECNKTRWVSFSIIVLTWTYAVLAIMESNPLMWMLALALVFWSWLRRIRNTEPDGSLADELQDNPYDYT